MTHQQGPGSLSVSSSVIIGAVLISASIIYASYRAPARTVAVQGQAVQAQPTQAAAKAPSVTSVKSSPGMVVGNPSAPIVVAYWYDYQCPFCKQVEETAMNQVFTEYVKTGKIRVVYKDLQFLGPDSTTVGLLGRAVWEIAPAKFHEWHTAIFANQGREHSGWATKEKLLSVTAGVLGQVLADKAMALSVSKASVYQAAMDADKAEGATYGIRSTPSFIIGNAVVNGARPYADIKNAIDIALKK